MLRVVCHTNLDLSHEEWATTMPCVPAVGHTIVSRTVHDRGFQLELRVTAIEWKYDSILKEWVPKIELHMTDWQCRLPASREGAAVGSIVAFYEWYAPKVGRTVSAFI